MVNYSFDVSHPVDQEEQVKEDIIGNVTKSFTALFAQPGDNLYPLSQSFGLAFSERPSEVPLVDKVEDAEGKFLHPLCRLISSLHLISRLIRTLPLASCFCFCSVHTVCCPSDIECTFDSNQPNIVLRQNICSRFELQMYFQHTRDISKGYVRGWLLDASDRVKGNLTAVYAGDRAAHTTQIMTIENLDQEPENAEEICPIVFQALSTSQSLAGSSFAILDVTCTNPVWIPREGIFKTRRRDRGRLLRRQLQTTVLGDLNIEFTVSAEYTPASREKEEVKKDEEFAELVEVSILELCISYVSCGCA